jgi:hypothetical protein
MLNESMETNCRVVHPSVTNQKLGVALHAPALGSAAVAHFDRSLIAILHVVTSKSNNWWLECYTKRELGAFARPKRFRKRFRDRASPREEYGVRPACRRFPAVVARPKRAGSRLRPLQTLCEVRGSKPFEHCLSQKLGNCCIR